jgi:glycosyltransferase involved in cell wall biosynthesis
VPLECDVPIVLTIPDLSVLLHPEWHPPIKVLLLEEYVRQLNRCSHLFALSAASKREIVKHLGWPGDQVSVTYPGVRASVRRLVWADQEAILQERGLAGSYLLHVSTLEPRTNVLMLLRAYCSLPESIRERCPLVLAGAGGWKCDEVHEFIRAEGHDKNVHYLGYVPDRLLAALYGGARALLIPSLHESFCLPAVEMLSGGGLVIASALPALIEATGGKGMFLNPHDEDGWRDSLQKACSDRDWRMAKRDGAAEAVAHHTWEHCAQDTLAGYERVLSPAIARPLRLVA